MTRTVHQGYVSVTSGGPRGQSIKSVDGTLHRAPVHTSPRGLACAARCYSATDLPNVVPGMPHAVPWLPGCARADRGTRAAPAFVTPNMPVRRPGHRPCGAQRATTIRTLTGLGQPGALRLSLVQAPEPVVAEVIPAAVGSSGSSDDR